MGISSSSGLMYKSTLPESFGCSESGVLPLRKLVLLLICISLSFCLSACASSTPYDAESMVSEMKDGYQSYISAMGQKYTELIEQTKDADYTQLITQPISLSEYKTAFTPGNITITHISSVDAKFPFECLRQPSGSSAYAIYKTDDGGWIYAFFRPLLRGNAGGFPDMLSYSFYVKQGLEYGDFTALKTGSSLADAQAIDPTVGIWSTNNEAAFISPHLLRDGVLLLQFKKTNGEYKLTEKRYFKDFQVPTGTVDEENTCDCRIAPADYPQ